MIPLGYGAGMESRLDPRTGLEVRSAAGSMDSRSVGGMESRSVGLGVEMRDAVADREEVVISTLSWPPDQPDTISQGQLARLCFTRPSLSLGFVCLAYDTNVNPGPDFQNILSLS